MKKAFISTLLVIAMAVSASVPVSADEEDDLRSQQQAAEQELAESNERLDQLTQEQIAVQSQISTYYADIADLMIRIDQAKSDIADTESRIADTEEQIGVTEADLSDAEATRDKQYKDMKKRIQYIYENGGEIGWATMVLASEDITSFLNRADYTEQLHAYDRKMLQEYVDNIDRIESLKEDLESQKKDLQDQRDVQTAQEAALEADEADLETALAEAQRQDADYANQIEQVRAQADQIESLIDEMQQEIERIQAEKEAARKAAEEAARKAAEEAAKKAAEEEAARKAAEEAAAEAARQAAADAAAAVNDGGGSAESETSYTPTGSGGDDIIAYARQFVGCPYVWGGWSLTNGCDCSHFVYLCLKNLGYYDGPYMTSGSWAYLGSPVGSISEAQAGDVIVYSGHVAFYDGNGKLVEAMNEENGITDWRSATSKPIVAIRRFT